MNYLNCKGVDTMPVRKYPVTKILLKNNIITDLEAQQIMESDENNKSTEIELIYGSGVMSEEELMIHISNIFHLEECDIDNVTIPDSVFNEIPTDILGKLYILPFQSTDDNLEIAISDPTDINGLESLSYYTAKNLIFKIAKRSSIIKIYQFRTSQSKSNEAVESLIQEFKNDEVLNFGKNIDDDSDAPTIQLTNAILVEAITADASDIHVEPYENYIIIRYRIDGILKEVFHLPSTIYSALIARFKLICGMDISERRVPQEGRLEVVLHDKPVDIRFSTIPNVFGEKLVMRILQKKFLNTTIHELGFSDNEYALVEKMLSKANGIILVTGPTGSGKSTTLYSFLNNLKTATKAIVTVEDPVEYTIDGFNQTQVNLKQGLTFPICLRAVLRQDPDIIMIGEIRDEETAEIAVRASITGHLVLSTLHTNNSVSSISRLINMGIEPYLIADSLRGVIAQRLMRRLCSVCKEKSVTTEVEMEALNLDKPKPIYHAKGCKACNNTGYSGRFAVFEVLYITSEIKQCIQNNHEVLDIEKFIQRKKFLKLYDSGITAVLKGETSIQELRRLDHDE